MKSLLTALVLFLFGISSKLSAQPIEVSEHLKDSLSSLALQNILKAERVFCYTLEMPSSDYEGYTLDQMAITGFCGILEENEKKIFIEEFLTKQRSLSTQTSNCVIKPRVMLRFFRGVDSTDVLVSLPCASLTFFYGGTLKSLNAEPSSQSIQDFLNIYEKRHLDFVSPALINQLLPVGLPQTEEQRALVAKQKKAQPKRNWVTEQQPQEKPQNEAPKGWNKINLGKKNR